MHIAAICFKILIIKTLNKLIKAYIGYLNKIFNVIIARNLFVEFADYFQSLV